MIPKSLSGKRSLRRLRAVVVRAGHQAPTRRWSAGGRAQADRRHHRPFPMKIRDKSIFRRPKIKEASGAILRSAVVRAGQRAP